MKLVDLIHRGTPQPWAEGDNIPWYDPDFSRRMLKEHLTQEHDAATRRLETVDRHVRFITETVLEGQPNCRVLDLGCGPGIYTHRFARLGHTVHGIDFGPASIEYARLVAEREHLTCTYTLSDVRAAEFPPENDLVMFIFGEFNVFRLADARAILRKARAALKPGGRLLLEPHRPEVIERMGHDPAHWYSSESGLFSERPHLLLREGCWDETTRAATHRYYVVDAQSGEVTRFAASYQAYTLDEYRDLLAECGFPHFHCFPSLTGEEDNGDFWAIYAA